MPLKDIVIAALSRPMGRVVDSPVRDIVDEALRDRGYASPAEVAALKEEIGHLRTQLQALPGRVDKLEQQLTRTGQDAAALREAMARSELAAGEARRLATEATARAEAAERRAAEAEARAAEAMATRSEARPSSSAEAAEAVDGARCRVPGCAAGTASNGFCTPHLLSWKAGRLPGFVSPEGLVDLGGGVGRVPAALAGQPYEARDGRVRVSGRFASVTTL